MDPIDDNQKVSFDEFRLFYESAEKVTDRRLSANRWNYSISIAILAGIGVIINWGMSKPEFLATAAISVVVISAMAALYCSLWIGQIRDFKELNNAKFTVLNEMAPHIRFGEGYDDSHNSCQPFEREWDALKAAQATQEVRSINIVALKSSNIEYLIPKAFRVLFVLLIVVVPLEAYRNHDNLAKTTIPSTTVSAPAKTGTP